jgi:hypothetical protein
MGRAWWGALAERATAVSATRPHSAPTFPNPIGFSPIKLRMAPNGVTAC